MAIKSPAYKLTLNGKDITINIEEDLIYMMYRDRTEAECDELEIVLDDTHLRWSNGWYPEKGAKLNLQMGYKDGMVNAGQFEIDAARFQLGDQGRSVRIKALSAMVTEPLRTKKSYTYAKTTLLKIAQTVASRGHMTVSGVIEPITIDFVMQFRETDLGFLRRISMQYGYMFNIKAGKLVFTKMTNLQARNSVIELSPTNMRSVDIEDTTGRTFKLAEHKYYDAATGTIKESEASGSSGSDLFASFGTVENKQQAELKAKAAMAKILNGQVQGTIVTWMGMPSLLAGNNVTVTKIGAFSGVFNIEASTHMLTKGGGYDTNIEVFKNEDIALYKR